MLTESMRLRPSALTLRRQGRRQECCPTGVSDTVMNGKLFANCKAPCLLRCSDNMFRNFRRPSLPWSTTAKRCVSRVGRCAYGSVCAHGHTGSSPRGRSITRALGDPLGLLSWEILGFLTSGSSFLPLVVSPRSSVWGQGSICP